MAALGFKVEGFRGLCFWGLGVGFGVMGFRLSSSRALGFFRARVQSCRQIGDLGSGYLKGQGT